MVAVLLLLLVALLVAALAVEVAVGKVAHDRTERLLAEAFDAPVTVALHGRPLTLDLVRRRIPAADLVAREVPLGDTGGRIGRLDVRLEGVLLPRDRDGEWRVEQGVFEAHLDSDDLADLADLPPGVEGVRLVDDTVEVRTTAGVRFPASLDVEDGDLVLRADRGVLRLLPTASFRVPLGDLPAGARVRDVALNGGEVTARGVLGGRLGV